MRYAALLALASVAYLTAPASAGGFSFSVSFGSGGAPVVYAPVVGAPVACAPVACAPVVRAPVVRAPVVVRPVRAPVVVHRHGGHVHHDRRRAHGHDHRGGRDFGR